MLDSVRGVEQPLVASLYADDTVLLAENEGDIKREGRKTGSCQ